MRARGNNNVGKTNDAKSVLERFVDARFLAEQITKREAILRGWDKIANFICEKIANF